MQPRRYVSYGARVGFDPIGDVLRIIEKPVDAVGNLVLKVPGASWVKGAFESGASFLGDMAKDPFGNEVLTWISDGLAVVTYSAPVLGVAVASLAWTMPDALRHECFTEAYVKEFVNRLLFILPDDSAKAAVVP